MIWRTSTSYTYFCKKLWFHYIILSFYLLLIHVQPDQRIICFLIFVFIFMYFIILVLSSFFFYFFFCSVFHHYSEIYNIVSQKQMRDPPEGDTIRPTNIEPIDVKPTVNSDNVRKQCCQSS